MSAAVDRAPELAARPVPGWSAYLVYPDGRVWSIKTARFLRTNVDYKGYVQIVLNQDTRRRTTRVHRLVAEAFLGAGPGVPVNHIDGVKTHNGVSNLEVTTREANDAHAIRLRLRACGERSSSARFTERQVREIRALVASGTSRNAVARRFGVHRTAIGQIVARKTWRHVTDAASVPASQRNDEETR